LRHTAINDFGCFIKDWYKTAVFARHSRGGVTAVYRHYDLVSLRDDLASSLNIFSVL
jgi:hypothetical protein